MHCKHPQETIQYEVQDFVNCLKVLNHLLELFPPTDDDKFFTEINLKANFSKAMHNVWQQNYALKDTQAKVTFRKMMSYFTTYPSIMDLTGFPHIMLSPALVSPFCGQNTNTFKIPILL
jgi:hypothetical protein